MRAYKEKNVCFESNDTIDYRGQHLTKQGATFETLTGQEGTKQRHWKKQNFVLADKENDINETSYERR